jgi:hypothetical protein
MSALDVGFESMSVGTDGNVKGRVPDDASVLFVRGGLGAVGVEKPVARITISREFNWILSMG